jgi:hypothetical protein
VALLRMNLFTHRDLWRWLDQPFEGPPTILVAALRESSPLPNRDSKTRPTNSPGNRGISSRDPRQFDSSEA